MLLKKILPSTSTARQDLIIFFTFFFILGSVALFSNAPNSSKLDDPFAGEYGNIAAAIINGKGYSSPFLADSGPTSWMPPLYTFLLASLFSSFGIKTTTSVVALFVIKYLGLSLVAIMLVRISRTTCSERKAWLVLPIYLCLLLYYFGTFFHSNHDEWFLMVILTALFYSYSRQIHDHHCAMREMSWGMIGGLAFLASPVLGMVYLVLTIAPFRKANWKQIIIAMGVSFLILSPWCIRNYLVFDQVILIKSNLFYELYQNNYLDEDGLFGKETTEMHPQNNENIRNEYISSGERVFMEKYRTAFLHELDLDRATFFKKSIQRLIHIFLVYPADYSSPAYSVKYILKASIYWVPFFISLCYLVTRTGENKILIYIAITIFFVYLTPYIFVGFYKRYRVPLLPIFAFLYLQAFLFLNKSFRHFIYGPERVA